MRAIIGLVDSQKKVPPSAPTLVLAEDTGSNRNFDNGASSLTWTAPTFNGKSAITGYDITATADDNSTVIFATGVVLNSSITGLKSGKKYTYKVKARNGGGPGNESNPRGPITATTKPGIPVNVTATNLNNGSQASVTWTAGPNGGSPITLYTVTRIPGGQTQTTTSLSLTFGGLTNNSSYTFTVAATNINGISDQSSPSNQITITEPVAPPPPPPPPPTPPTSCWTNSGAPYCRGSDLVQNQTDPCGGAGTRTITVNVNGCIVPPVPPIACCQDDDAGFCSGGIWFQNQYDPCGYTSCGARNTGGFCYEPPTPPPTPPTPPPTPPTPPPTPPTPPPFVIPFNPTPPPTAAPTPPRPTTTGPFAPWPEYFYTGVGGRPLAPVPQYPYYCLSVDSMIPTPNGDKRLAELSIGDQIISARFEEIDPDDPNADLIVDTWSSDSFTYRELDITTVVNIREWEETGRYTINNRIKVTGSHPFIAKESADGRYYYTRAAQLVEGDMLFDGDLEAWVPVHSIDYEPNVRFKVRTLSTEPYDMFFAEGILVHNK